MDLFLSEFEEISITEQRWLRELYQFVEGTLCTVNGHDVGSALELALAVVRRLQRTVGSEEAMLPLAYRFVSVSELVTRQHTFCCSRLSWATIEHGEWAEETERALSTYKALSPAYLLLAGFLTDGSSESDAGCDGTWTVMDSSGCVSCELLCPTPEWLGHLMLFPSWNYIPLHPSGPGQEPKGYLEMRASPLSLVPSPRTFDPGGSLSKLMGTCVAARVLQLRERQRGFRLNVFGQVCAVGPLLEIGGKSFFCFCLKEEDISVPVLVMERRCLHWQPCLHVPVSLCVSGLRVCRLREWPGHQLLCATPESCLCILKEPPAPLLTWDQVCGSLGHHGKTGSERQEGQETERDTQMETDTQAETNSTTGMQPVTTLPQTVPAAKTKISKMISYKGVITKVLSSEAGLYEIDGKVGLCLAYQPLPSGGHRLRPGAEIELHDVHFLYRPSPHTLPTMLCACLRSSLRVTGFSRLETGLATCTSRDPPALCLQLERNLGVSQYLWTCHCLSALRERLCPRLMREGRLRAVARKLLSCVVPPGQEGGRPRDLYREMLEQPHCCPLTEYSVDSPACELISVRDLQSWLEAECWDSMSLQSLLPPSAPNLTRAALNPLLAWSVHVLPAATLRKPKVLVGVLQLSRRGPSVRLVDQTGKIDCVVVEKREGISCAAYNTAWLDCLVCVQRYTLVMERFLATDFPAWTHLDQERYITHKHCRLYIRLCLDDLTVLSPSAAMVNFRSVSEREKGEKQGDEGVDEAGGPREGCSTSERSGHVGKEGEGAESKLQTVEDNGENAGSRAGDANKPLSTDPARSKVVAPAPCMSVVLSVQSKEGLSFRNVRALGNPGLSPCFGVSAVLLGEVQTWGQDPKNCPLEQKEMTEGVRINRVELQFTGDCARWYPFLQPGCVYRMVARHTEDPAVFPGCSLPGQGSARPNCVPSVLIQPHWRFHTLPALQQGNWRVEKKVMSVSEVLSGSTTPSLVSFEGVISERISLIDEKGKTPTVQSLPKDTDVDVEEILNIRLTVQDLVSRDRSIQVYVDLSQKPYPPGLLPGATVLFQSFERKVSRIGNVYCRSVHFSCVTVTALEHSGSAVMSMPPPIMHLGEWVLRGVQCCRRARLRAHVVCVLYLQLKWVCSLCASVFKQDACTRDYPPCTSTTGVFQAEAKAVVEDGTREAQVWFSSQTVPHLLALTVTEWEGLQRLVRVRGYLRVYHRGRSVVSDAVTEDPLLQYLSYLCVCAAVCRPVSLTCELQPRFQSSTAHRSESSQPKRFSRGDREFITRIPAPLQLQCIKLSEWESSA
ncbi:hypothetical protein GJAV_G00200290 [Gymnothorax javanicus]|nr:hypothetical protein GJAV_G00200290 [Gymnothorax javanicus]